MRVLRIVRASARGDRILANFKPELIFPGFLFCKIPQSEHRAASVFNYSLREPVKRSAPRTGAEVDSEHAILIKKKE